MTLRLRSIRVRLVGLALLGTVIATVLAGIGLVALFDRHLERRVGQELDSYLTQLAGNLRVAPDGSLALRAEPGDPRFQRPLSGLYWQVRDEATGALLRSRSLWDAQLGLPEGGGEAGRTLARHVDAPNGHPALQHDTVVILTDGGTDRPVRLSVAVDKSEIAALRAGFAYDLVPGLGLLAALILAASWFQAGAGLNPLGAVRTGIGLVREGRARRLDPGVPSEIAPLVDEVNSLLAAQEATMMRARDRAADLAHGLKTPLTALVGDVARLRAAGQGEIADDIEALAVQMRRTVERELARARLRHRVVPPAVGIADTVDAVARTLSRTPIGSRVAIVNAVARDVIVPMQREDLFEILGNLLENAVRAARCRVQVTAVQEGHGLVIGVEDDGAGLSPAESESLTGRGRRRDEAGGAGLGLAIVGDILEAYGGELRFRPAPSGGLVVEVALPARSGAVV